MVSRVLRKGRGTPPNLGDGSYACAEGEAQSGEP